MDAIDRQAAIATAVRAAIDWHRLANPQYSIAYCIGEAMRALPAAEPERKKGKWIDEHDMTCSVCGFECDDPYYLGDAKYCPNCGSYNGGET